MLYQKHQGFEITDPVWFFEIAVDGLTVVYFTDEDDPTSVAE